MEKREYSVIGKVEIGTDEYRDLISGLVEAEKSAEEYRSKFWSEQTKNGKLEEELKFTKEKASNNLQFINEINLVDKFKLWKLEKQEEEE